MLFRPGAAGTECDAIDTDRLAVGEQGHAVFGLYDEDLIDVVFIVND